MTHPLRPGQCNLLRAKGPSSGDVVATLPGFTKRCAKVTHMIPIRLAIRTRPIPIGYFCATVAKEEQDPHLPQSHGHAAVPKWGVIAAKLLIDRTQGRGPKP